MGKKAKMKTLKDAPVGKSSMVVRVRGEGALRRHIMDMGITKGTEVYVRKVAPLGDSTEIMVRGYGLSLRKMDTEILEMQQGKKGDLDGN